VSGGSIALATLRLTATGSGTAEIALVDITGILAGFSEVLCIDETAECRTARVNVQ
jgi:hypothetical protein